MIALHVHVGHVLVAAKCIPRSSGFLCVQDWFLRESRFIPGVQLEIDKRCR